jgi:predicted glycosyltransferase involved in capsule biosynthesis
MESNMNEINNTLVKFNMDNLTFILPVGIETQDRYRNFLFTINYLINVCPEANFIIHEMGDVNYSEKVEHARIKKIFTKTSKIDEKFYKTWCINRAIEQAKTKVICIYDVDVLIPLKSIEKSVGYIVDGYDMVLPYNYGPYQKQILNFKECEQFIKSLNFDDFKTVRPNNSFYGHVQFFNKSSYMEVGCENEDMIGWGPEDQEKLFKMYSLGYKVKYLDDAYVWHIEHSRLNPTPWMSDIHSKNMEIFEKIKNMSEIERKEYYSNQAKKLLKNKETHVSTI